MTLDEWDWLPRPLFYVVATGAAIWMVLGRLSEGKGHVADLLSPLSRRMRERVERREKEDHERRKRELRAVLLEEDAPEYLAQVRRIEALDKAVKWLEAEIVKLNLIEQDNTAARDMTAGYLREDAQWHERAGVRIAELGITLPEHRSYTEFCRDYLRSRGQPTNRRWNDNDVKED